MGRRPAARHAGPLAARRPSFDKDGNLYCVDVVTGRIYKVTRDGTFHIVAEYDGWPNGLKFHQDGRCFIADYKNGIMLLDPVNGKITPYLERAGLERFKAVNDLFFAGNGDLYFTDQGLTGLHDPTGRVFRVRPNGQVTCLLNNIPSPNGLVMNRDETILYVAVTRGNCIWRVPFTASGDVVKVGIYIQLSGGGGPDGLALDDEGRLLIAHVALGSVWVFDRFGEPVYRIKSCTAHHTTNVAFGWPDRKTLYIRPVAIRWNGPSPGGCEPWRAGSKPRSRRSRRRATRSHSGGICRQARRKPRAPARDRPARCDGRPPPVPLGVSAWDWWFRVQVAAALAIARSTDRDDGGDVENDDVQDDDNDLPDAESTLLSLARGPHDWSAAGSLDRNPRGCCSRVDLAGLGLRPCRELQDHEPDFGAWCIGDALEELIRVLEPLVATANEDRARRQQQRSEILAGLEIGRIVTGTIVAMTEYGAFVDSSAASTVFCIG